MAKHLDLEEQEQLDQLKHFWNTWGTLISTAVILVAGAAVAWNGYQYWQSRQAAQAAALFDAVDVAASSGDQSRVEQAFGDLKSKYSGTTQAGQAGLMVAKAMQVAGNTKGAQDALEWVTTQSSDGGLKALAQLRLSSLLMDQKSYDDALKKLSSDFPPEFSSVVADRKGDILLMQDKRQEAVSEYTKAYKEFDSNVEYRRLVEMKLNSLGVSPQDVAVFGSAPSTEAK